MSGWWSFGRIAETAFPVHTCAACTSRVIPVETVTLKEQWPKQLVQHLFFLTNEWAVVFVRIAETALPVHTCGACTDEKSDSRIWQ